MPQFAYLKLSCPICNGARKDCRQSLETDLIFCLSNNQAPQGYKHVGHDSHSFGMYAVAAEDSSAVGFSRDVQNAKFVSMRRKLELAQESNRKGMLDAAGRDENWKAIAKQLKLEDRHKYDLIGRGLSAEAIAHFGFKSVERNHPLDYKVNNKQAGINQAGNGMITKAGYLVPISNNHSQVIGWQVKTDDSSNGKYVWAAPVTVNKKELSAHTKEEFELPLQMAYQVESKVVGLCEGTLKPLVASHRHNLTMIGSSGGNFASSSKLLKQYLADACEAACTDTVTIFPDSGSLSNPNVAKQLEKTVKTVESFGYRVLIASWGQLLDKSFPDIDELASLATVAYVTPAQVKRIADGQEVSFFPNLMTEEAEELLEKMPQALAQTAAELEDKVGRDLLVVEKQEIKKYKQGCLPEYSVGDAGATRWEITPNQRIYFYQEAIKKGYPIVLDNSAPGTGKSYSVARLSNQFLSGDPGHLWYLSKQSRNPSTAGVEQMFNELPVRNNGFDYDEHKTTPLGYPQRKAKKAEYERKEGNCHYTAAFQSARSKGISVDLCKKCPFKKDCGNASGDGYGYRHEMREAMINANLRANPKSLVETMIKGGAIAIVDEPSQALDATTEWKLSINEVLRTARWLLNLDMYSMVAQEIWMLVKRLTGFCAGVSPSGYGFETSEIVKDLNVKNDLTEHINWVDQKTAELEEELATGKNTVNSISVIPTQWVRAFLETLQNGYGAINVHNDTITIVTPNTRLRDTLGAFRSVIYQDATLSVTKLGLMLDKPTDSILVCEVSDTSSENLEFVQITGLGNGSVKRSDIQQSKLDLLQKKLTERHSELGAIDWKRHAKPGELIFFSDARGSNAFESKSALLIKGVPYPNVTAVSNECACYYGIGQKTATQLIYDDSLVGELIQAFGRIRANQKPGQKLTIYFASDLNLSFLSNQGYKVTKVPAIEFSKSIATRSQLALRALTQGFKELGNCESISTMASHLGKSAASISQVTKRFGGWKPLSKLLSVLLSAPLTVGGDRKMKVSESNVESLLTELSQQSDLIKNLPQVIRSSNRIDLIFKVISLLPVSAQARFTQVFAS